MGRCGRVAFVLAIGASFAGAAAGAERQRCDLRRAAESWVVLALSGKQTVTCHSGWHHIKADSTIGGALPVRLGDLLALRGGLMNVQSAWVVPAARLRAFGEGLFESMKLTHGDPEAYAKWYGSDPRDRSLDVSGGIGVELAGVTAVDGVRVARIKLLGRLELRERAIMGSRYGPNLRKATWNLKVEGTAELDLGTGRARTLALSLTGGAKGGYGPEEGPPADPFEIAVRLRLRAGPLPDDVEARFEKLIAEMGHDEFARREAATEEARKLPPGYLSQLLLRLERSDDPELRYRASLLKPKPPPKRSPRPPIYRGW